MLQTINLRQAKTHQEALEEQLGAPISNGGGYGLTQSLDADARDPATWPDLLAWLVNRLQAYVEALEAIVSEPLGTQP